MNKIFNNIRWGELASGLAGLSGFLTALSQAPVPTTIKLYSMLGVAMIGFVLAFFRNPKDLEWVSKAADVAEVVDEIKKLSPDQERAEKLRAELAKLEGQA